MTSTSRKTWPLVDLGAGRNPRTGAFAVDIVKFEGKTDLVADVAHLPFRDNSFESVNASDIIEHFPTFQVPQVLAEWIRVAKDRITLKTPNLKVLAEAYMAGHIDCREFSRKVYGGGSVSADDPNWKFNLHFGGVDNSSIKLLLESLLLYDIQITPGSGGDWSNVLATARKRVVRK